MKTPTLKSYLEYTERMIADDFYGRIEIVSSVEGTAEPERPEIGDFTTRTVLVDCPVSCGVKEYYTGEITWEQFRSQVDGSLKKKLSVRPGFYSESDPSHH